MTSEREPADPTRTVFDAVETHADLIRWSRAYATDAVESVGFAVDLDAVEWEVSTRAKRRAAAVKAPTVPGATVGEPIDWGETAVGGPGDDPPTCTVSLSWRAAASFDRDEWAATLRHELVHVEQFQADGATDHGSAFKRRAAAVDAPVRVRRFADPSFVLACTDCGAEVAHRYRRCKLVRRHESYRSTCCDAPLSCTGPDGTE